MIDDRQFEILKEMMDAPIANTSHTCATCLWLESEFKHICTHEETPAMSVSGYENTFGCNFWEAK